MTLQVLTDVERGCLGRSVAREESWPVGMPIRSDLDLAVVTRRPLTQAEQDALVDAT